ncbi:TlpA family protein disulfide reductase [Corynebacterium bovis]|uniref:TlpA family protein disulfide reductase n=4 Tax=Corynebacterium bovis TaxID=36808 RepID=A0A3R8RGC9_9CORY|nr:TlpA disulfide reductase family protein [Corynebacterium bovis]MDK8511067.1 TlpA disulfide reductase family protein [Corynebacterium bovis]MDN8579728.1 TlpA disulfide reductase family protein [Corynebacterium bovis]RRO81421.1 TlpA family protein disulfide reductase [Corynebacterium bovis]RRO83278.1 TlpA family protein disulfide reductase [Corynebacterium bovis]RRO84792.1 TlpA family protein disulfide reductase [Corynebacterium bovis]
MDTHGEHDAETAARGGDTGRRGHRTASLRPTHPGRAPGPMIRRSVAAAAAVALAGAALVGCGDNATAGKDAVAVGGSFEFVSPGGQTEITYDQDDRRPVGNITGDSLMQPGTTIRLSDYDGKVVVLNSWGQWCGPCRSESDDLQRVQEKLDKDGRGTLLGINVRDNARDKARDFVTDNGITYPSIYDPPFKSALALGGLPASVIPTTIVLDKQHRPAKIFLREVTDTDLWAAVEPLLGE